ncbi:adenylyl-sulfate kinase, partial [Candidatus Parcubacteria bacterium]
TPLEECIKRDVKGLYRRAQRGEIENFTGISSPYEPPLNPDIHLSTAQMSVDECVEKVVSYLQTRGLIY